MNEINSTQFYKVQKESQPVVRDVIDSVYLALTEQGYNPVSQIVGYVMSGDPTYITSFHGARSLIMKVERDEIIEELLQDYIKNNFDGTHKKG
ncbi:MAG: IreB family regulatory phosphoprotein [Lachnospiraceae bacterium]|nr:IreB family regulatory phosphoprotein [Lachnospiraceae bacterium]